MCIHQGVVKIAAVNADEHQSLGGQYQIQGFPTIKVFGANKNSPSDYQGTRSNMDLLSIQYKACVIQDLHRQFWMKYFLIDLLVPVVLNTTFL